MEVEKRGSKGGFLQLFDWNVKSRKKLFSNNSELSEGSKQGKENFDCEAVKKQENGPGPSVKGSSRDYNCAFSEIGDEGHGTRAPSVVARLMGLDSLPMSHASQPSCTSFLDSHSFRGIHSQRITTAFQSEHHDIAYSSMQDKLEGFVTNPVDMRMQKVQSQPIQRFQTEILPPKSAKSIPITRHKLLSPIKSPGFTTTQNATYIMEAAAKIIEHSPQSATKGRVTSSRPPSVPLRIHNLKGKIEAAQKASRLPDTSRRPRDSSSVNHMKGQPNDRKQNGSERTQLYKASVDLEKGSSERLRNKKKSVSLAVQAKVNNIQTREGLTSSVNRNFMNHKVDNEVKLGHFDKSQQNAQRRTLTGRRSDVLRQNNQKQNCVSHKDKVSLKLSNQEDRKPASMNLSSRPTKPSNKVVVDSATRTRKTKSVATDCGKEHSSCKAKNSSKKKQLVSGHTHCEESGVDNILVEKNERSIKCNVAVDGCMNWDAVERKNSMDIVSFTFTSPIKKSMPASQLPRVLERNDSCPVNPYNDQSDFENSTLSSLGLTVTGGDALNVLLEQKLKELACMVDSSHSNLVNTGVASNLQGSGSTPNFVNSMLTDYEKGFQLGLQNDKPDGLLSSDCSLADGLLHKAKRNWEGSKVIEEHCNTSNQSEYRNELAFQCPSPVSSLVPSFSDGSCYSSDSKTSFSSYGGKHFLLSEAQGTFNCISAKMPPSVEGEAELSDSASSMYTACTDRKDTATTFSFVDFRGLSNCDLDYVRDILCNAELVWEDFAACQTQRVINPNLFDQLENQKIGSYKNMEEVSKLGRRVLFDCVSECMQLRCKRLLIGGCKAWARWEMLSLEKGWLAEELYKEIAGWTSMGDLMVDELVDKDMSTQYGKWVDFEIESFEEGVELEEEVLSSLIDEFVTDLLF